MEQASDLRQTAEKLLKRDRFAAENGISLLEFRPGYARARMQLSQRHRNGFGAVQGGATYTLADFTFAAASNAKGRLTVSSSAHVSYFRPPQGKSLTAEAKEISAGNRLCTYNVDVFDEDGTLAARCTINGYITSKRLEEAGDA